MALKIVRNDITRMQADIIVNTANEHPTVGTGCDYAIYQAAGYDELLACREEIGEVPEGEVFITPAFRLQAKYIIHAVSPRYIDGEHGEEEKLRSCYRKSLLLAAENGAASIAFPLIATGSFGYPQEEGLRIAMDETNAFLMSHDMLVYLVVFDDTTTELGKRLFADLDSYIDQHYVEERRLEEYDRAYQAARRPAKAGRTEAGRTEAPQAENRRRFGLPWRKEKAKPQDDTSAGAAHPPHHMVSDEEICASGASFDYEEEEMAPPPAAAATAAEFSARDESALGKRMLHLTDTFSEYLIYLIDSKHMTYPEVYRRAMVDKKAFSKIKNNPDAHPKKMTVMCLCIGAMLNLDETKDLMARAGYALSPCEKTDIIFAYFIENQIYDMVELDIQLEEYGEPCLIP